MELSSTSYSDNPDAGGGGGFKDFPVANLDEASSDGFVDSPNNDPDSDSRRSSASGFDPPNTPGVESCEGSFPFTPRNNLVKEGTNAPPASSVFDAAHAFEPYSDNPWDQYSANDEHQDEEGRDNSIFVHGNNGSSSSSSSSDVKHSLKVGILGFSFGIIVMLGFLLMKGGDQTGLRHSSANLANGDENINGLDKGNNNQSIPMNPIGESNNETVHLQLGEPGVETPANDNNQEASSEQTVEDAPTEPATAVEESATSNKNDSNESKEVAAVTAKVQEPPPATTPPAVTNEEIVAPAPSASVQEVVPFHHDRENPDLSQFCGGCEWKNSHFTCNQRVDYLNHVTKTEAKKILMQQGHCPEKVDANAKPGTPYSAQPGRKSILPTITDCRVADSPFCFHCQWKFSEFNCLTRVYYLNDMYNTGEEGAMKTLMDQGHCKNDQSPEEKQRLKDLGLEYWCGFCKFRTTSCEHRVTAGGLATNETQITASKLDLMEHGECTLPLYCDEQEQGGHSVAINITSVVGNAAANATVP